MRVISGPELAIIQGQTFKTDPRLEVENVDGTWVDLSSRFIAADVTDDVDQKAVTVVFTLARDSGDTNAASLSPLMSESTLNVDDDDDYAPIITAGRRFRFSVCCVALTSTFASGTYHELVTGRFDKPSFAAAHMSVEARDLGGLLIDSIATADATYGDEDDPVAALAVGQQYLDDNMGDDAPALVDESGTDFTVTQFRQVNVSLMEGLNALATKAGGLVVRYKYDSDGVAQLTMFDPLRENTTPAVTLTPSRYIEIPTAAIDATNVRNIIRGEYIDPVTGELARITPDPTDTDSVAAFGPRFMQLGAEVFDGLTGNEVLTVLNAALADLALPKFDHEVTRLGFWPVEIGDVIEWAPNGTTYDQTQTLAVVGYTHRFERGTFRTTFRCRGTPAGAYLDWIRRQGTGPTGPIIPPAPELMFLVSEGPQFGLPAAQADGAVWLGYRVDWDRTDEIRFHVLQGDGPNMPVPNPDGTTLAPILRKPEGTFAEAPTMYESVALFSTDDGLYKRILMQGVRGGLTSKPVIPPAIQAVDPSPMVVEGTLTLSVDRTDSTITVTATPVTLEPTLGANFVCCVLNKHILPPVLVGTSTDPVVFTIPGLDPEKIKDYEIDAFILNVGETWGVSGPRRRVIAAGPTIVAPEFALGTPTLANVAGQRVIQISWTGATPGATGGVRVEASLDRVSVRLVGTGALASGTVYDAATPPVSYRLVAVTALGERLATSEWRLMTTAQGPLSNPGAIPTFVNGTPKPVLRGLGGGFGSLEIVLSVQWRCASPGARTIQIQRSTDNGVGDPWTEVGRSGDVAAGEWRSLTSADVTIDAYYRLRALGAVDDPALAVSSVVHYVAPS